MVQDQYKHVNAFLVQIHEERVTICLCVTAKGTLKQAAFFCHAPHAAVPFTIVQTLLSPQLVQVVSSVQAWQVLLAWFHVYPGAQAEKKQRCTQWTVKHTTTRCVSAQGYLCLLKQAVHQYSQADVERIAASQAAYCKRRRQKRPSRQSWFRSCKDQQHRVSASRSRAYLKGVQNQQNHSEAQESTGQQRIPVPSDHFL